LGKRLGAGGWDVMNRMMCSGGARVAELGPGRGIKGGEGGDGEGLPGEAEGPARVLNGCER